MKRPSAKDWWAQRPLRERALLIAVATALPVAAGDMLVTAPMERKLRNLQSQVRNLQTRVVQADAARPTQVADNNLRQQEAAWRARLQTASAQAAELDRRVADAARLPEVLRSITATVGSLRLLELDLGQPALPTPATPAPSPNTPGAQPAAPAAAASAPAATPGSPGSPGTRRLYRLPINLKVSGSYDELRLLLQQIERQADALQWTSLTLDNAEWPAIQLTLKAYVLSREPRWGAAS